MHKYLLKFVYNFILFILVFFINTNLYDDKKNINLHHAAILIKFVMYL